MEKIYNLFDSDKINAATKSAEEKLHALDRKYRAEVDEILKQFNEDIKKAFVE
jgi:hypothetical protein